MNVLLHLACTVLAFALALRFFRGAALPAAVAALVFALHPAHVENVAWISGRTDLLAAAFALGALLLWLRARENGSAWLMLAATLCWGLGLMAKEVALFAPLGLFLFPEAAPPKNPGRFRLLLGLGCGLALALYLALRLKALGTLASALDAPGPGRFIPALGWVLAAYARTALTGFFIDPHHSDLEFEAMQGGMAAGGWAWILAAGAGLAWCLSHRQRDLARAFLLCGIFLAPVFALGSFGDVLYADRFLYLPSLGLGLALGLGLQRLDRTQALLFLGLLGLLLPLRTLLESRTWRDDWSLFSRSIRSSPKSGLVLDNLGLAAFKKGDWAQAEQIFRQALAQAEKKSVAHHSLALALRKQGRLAEALDHFNAALAADPLDTLFQYNRAETFAAAGRLGDAEAAYRGILAIKPGHARSLHNLGNLLLRQGRTSEARPLLEAALAGFADTSYTLNALGALAMEEKDYARARQRLNEALARNPHYENARLNLERLNALEKGMRP